MNVRLRQGGLSMVELLVALLIGLAVIGAGFQIHLHHLSHHRQLQAEVRLHQDLRAAVDLITRDLRRAGHWSGAALQTPPAADNPNDEVSATGNSIGYRFDSPSAASGSVVFSLSQGRLRMQIGDGSAQTLTDTAVMTVTRFDIQPVSERLALGHLCQPACNDLATCPHIEQRRYDIRVEARLPSDARVVRALDTSVQLRNDRLAGACPSGT